MPDVTEDTTTPAPPPAELTITLQPPVNFGGIDYGQLQLREPTAGEMIACDDVRGYAWMVKLASKVAAVPAQAVEKVRVSEILEAGEYLLGFTNAGRPASSAG